MRRFLGRKGSVTMFHFDYAEEDSTVQKSLYNMALSQGGGWYWDYYYGSYNSSQVRYTSAVTGITGYPFTEARYFSPLLGFGGSYCNINNSTSSPAPHRLDVIHPAIEAWIKPDTWEQDSVIAQFCPRVSTTKGGYGMRLNSSGELLFFITHAGGSEQSTTYDASGLSLDEYHYFAGLYDGTHIMLFVNGGLVEKYEVPTGGDLTYSLGGTEGGQIGYRNNDGTSAREYHFTGNIASIRFSYALTPWEIYNVYNSTNDASVGFSSSGATNLYDFEDANQQNSDPIVDSASGMDGIITDGAKGDDHYWIASPIGGTTEHTRCCIRVSATDTHAEVTNADIVAASSAMGDPTKSWCVEMLISIDRDYADKVQNGYLFGKAKGGIRPVPFSASFDTSDSLIRVYLRTLTSGPSDVVQAISRVYHRADRMMYIVATWDASTKTADLYFNGIHVGTDTVAGFNTSDCENSYPMRFCAAEYASSSGPHYEMNAQLHCMKLSGSPISSEDMVKFITGFNPNEDN